MNVKSIVDTFFYYKSNDTLKALFKDMVRISSYKNKERARYQWVRELALKEIDLIHTITLKDISTPKYADAIYEITNRIDNSYFFNIFQEKESFHKYNEYLTEMIQPTAQEMALQGIKNNFYQFYQGEEGTTLLQEQLHSVNYSKDATIIQKKLRRAALGEASLVNKVIKEESNYYRRAWMNKWPLSAVTNHMYGEESTKKYYDHLITALQPTIKEQKYYQLPKVSNKVIEDDEVPF